MTQGETTQQLINAPYKVQGFESFHQLAEEYEAIFSPVINSVQSRFLLCSYCMLTFFTPAHSHILQRAQRHLFLPSLLHPLEKDQK